MRARRGAAALVLAMALFASAASAYTVRGAACCGTALRGGALRGAVRRNAAGRAHECADRTSLPAYACPALPPLSSCSLGPM